MSTGRLQDKVAIVTGAGSGFGEGIAERFAAEGCAVIVNDIGRDAGERVAAAIRNRGRRAQFVHGEPGSAAGRRPHRGHRQPWRMAMVFSRVNASSASKPFSRP